MYLTTFYLFYPTSHYLFCAAVCYSFCSPCMCGSLIRSPIYQPLQLNVDTATISTYFNETTL